MHERSMVSDDSLRRVLKALTVSHPCVTISDCSGSTDAPLRLLLLLIITIMQTTASNQTSHA